MYDLFFIFVILFIIFCGLFIYGVRKDEQENNYFGKSKQTLIGLVGLNVCNILVQICNIIIQTN